MPRYLTYVFCIGLIALSCFNRNDFPQNNNILAKVGDRIITVQDFIRRAEYTIRPDYCKQSNYIHKKIVLNSLIAEKLIALEMEKEKDELLASQSFHNYLRGRKEQSMRQLFYHDKFFNKTGGVMVIEATKFNYAIPKTKLKAYRYNLPKVSIQQQI